MLLYAITDRMLFAEDEKQSRKSLIGLARELSRGGVDYLQIREKDLAYSDLLGLASEIVAAVREGRDGRAAATKVLLNGPPEIALEAGADGVHLPGAATAEKRDEAMARARAVYTRLGREAVISHSCHTADEAARSRAADVLLFAPVFEKKLQGGAGPEFMPGQGLARLREACEAAGETPVLALGGVTAQNAAACIQAGAKGVAGIRLFIGEDWLQLSSL